MKVYYRIDAKEMGVFLLKRRKIAKAFRWWLRENGLDYESAHFSIKSENKSLADSGSERSYEVVLQNA